MNARSYPSEAEKAVYQLSYVSSAVQSLVLKDIEDILAHAQKFNAIRGITGMLLYRGGIFLQILEGNRQEVAQIYKKIEKDSRHTKVKLLFEEENNPRVFADWSMAYKEISDLDLELINEILSWNDLITTAKNIDNHLILHMFGRFKKFIEV